MSWNPEIKKALSELLSSEKTPRIAVFDADGTLWNDDAGESFFKYQIELQSAPRLKNYRDPWQHYRNLEKLDAFEAYAWLAQINAGLEETALRAQAEDFYQKNFKHKAFPSMLELIKDLKAKDFEVWICSASIRWALEPVLHELGIPDERLIATEVRVKNGVLSSEVVEPIPFKLGKRLSLEKRLPGLPLLVAGNSGGDLHMLAMAQQLSLVIGYEPRRLDVKKSENQLRTEAQKRGWPTQIFRQ